MSKELDWESWECTGVRCPHEIMERHYVLTHEEVNLILTAKEDTLRKAVEGMKAEESDDPYARGGIHNEGYNQALADVLALLTPKN